MREKRLCMLIFKYLFQYTKHNRMTVISLHIKINKCFKIYMMFQHSIGRTNADILRQYTDNI